MSLTSWSRSIYREEAPRAGGPQLLLELFGAPGLPRKTPGAGCLATPRSTPSSARCLAPCLPWYPRNAGFQAVWPCYITASIPCVSSAPAQEPGATAGKLLSRLPSPCCPHLPAVPLLHLPPGAGGGGG